MNAFSQRAANAPRTPAPLIAILAVLGLLIASMLAGCASPQTASQQDDQGSRKLHVVASFYPLYDFAQKIGGDRVTVTNLVPAGTEPHDWEPSTADMKTIESANVFVYNGAGMEHWTHDVLHSIQNKHLVSVAASDGIALLPAASEDEHDHGHADDHAHEHGEDADHGRYDPHVWLAPENAKQEMKNIRDALVQADPDGKDVYEANYQTWSEKLDDLHKAYETKLSLVPRKTIVVSHQAFGYLCDAYGLTQMPIEGMEADAEPNAKDMARIVDFVKANNVSVIFSEELVSPKIAQAIADASGASCEQLNPLEGLTQEQIDAGQDYVSVMTENLDKLVKALS